VCKEVDAVGADGAKGYQCMGIDSDNGPKLTINHQGQGPNGGEPYYYVTVSDTGGENIEEGQFAKTEYAGTWMRVEWEVDRRNDPVTLSLWLISMGKAVNGEIPTNNTPDSPPEVLFDVTDVAMSGSSNFATAPWVYVGGKGCIGEVAWYRRRNLCSNGKVDGDESCDDGNFASDDGCSSSCETEANGDKLGFYKSCSEFEDTGGTGHTWIDPDLLTQDEANETEGRRVLCTDGWMEIAKNTGSTHFVSEHYLHGYRTLDPPDGNTESYVHPCTFVEAALGASTPQEIVVRLEMGGLVDYFRPTSDSSLCQMLSGYEHHDWYGDPGGLEDPGEIPAWFKAPAAEETWVDGDFTSTRHLGGSGHLDEQEGGWSTTGTGRDRLSFWGGDISPGGVFYGGCEEGGGMPFQIYKEQPFVLSAKNLDEGETVPESGCSGELNSP
jgi:cysteine-rich repeat protein